MVAVDIFIIIPDRMSSDTTEKMGFTGRGEGIAAFVMVLLGEA